MFKITVILDNGNKTLFVRSREKVDAVLAYFESVNRSEERSLSIEEVDDSGQEDDEEQLHIWNYLKTGLKLYYVGFHTQDIDRLKNSKEIFPGYWSGPATALAQIFIKKGLEHNRVYKGETYLGMKYNWMYVLAPHESKAQEVATELFIKTLTNEG